MEKSLFDIEMTKAGIMGEVEKEDYWAGYKRGLRRRFEGETFCTPEEHEQWMAYADADTEQLRERGRGYRNGYLGPVDLKDPANGVLYLRKWRGWSVAELAEMVGVTPDTVNGWEQGRIPSESEMQLLEGLIGQ
jgi:hypothetical protein